MARYSLWVKNIRDSKKDFIYQINLNGKVLGEKADLFDIDLFTTEYLNEHELLCSILNNTNVDDYKLEIRYQSNKRMRKLDVAYFNDVVIKNYSHLDRIQGKYIHSDDKDLKTIIDFILNDKICGNGIILRDILETKYINDYIKDKIKMYTYNRYAWSNNKRFFAKSKLLEELTRYKNIRGVMFFLKGLSQRHNISLPNILDRTNISPKKYEEYKSIIDYDTNKNIDDYDDIDKNIETEFNFYDPYQRNYDENIDEDLITEESTPSKKSRAKVYTKALPGQTSLFDVDDDR